MVPRTASPLQSTEGMCTRSMGAVFSVEHSCLPPSVHPWGRWRGWMLKQRDPPSSYSSWPQKGKSSLKASHAFIATAGDDALSQLGCIAGVLGVSSQSMYPNWRFWYISKTICLFSSPLHIATKHYSQVIAVNPLLLPEMGEKGQRDPARPQIATNPRSSISNAQKFQPVPLGFLPSPALCQLPPGTERSYQS